MLLDACRSKAWYIWGRPAVRWDFYCTTEESKSLTTTSKVMGLFSAFTSPYMFMIKRLIRKLEFLAMLKDMLWLKEGSEPVQNPKKYGQLHLPYEADKEEILKLLLTEIVQGNYVPIISIRESALNGQDHLIHNTTLAQELLGRVKQHNKILNINLSSNCSCILLL